MARVVPHGYGVRDSRTARVLADELDFAVGVQPDHSAAGVAGIFTEAVERHALGLRRELGVYTADLIVRPDNWYVDDGAANSWMADAHAVASGSPPFRIPKRLAGVYWDEVAPLLRGVLIEAGLALETARDIHVGTAAHKPGRWLAMDPHLAWAYSEEETAARIAMLAMRLVVPEHLDAVPAERIVAVRKDCGAEFDAFRDAVAAATGELAELSLESADPDIAAAYLDQIVARRFEQPLTDLRSAMRARRGDRAGCGWDEVRTACGRCGVGWQPGGEAAEMVAAAGGLAFALVGLGRSWKQGQQARFDASSPRSYLLRIDKGLRPRSLLAQVGDPRRHDDRTT